MDYADSESEVQFTPIRHNLIIFNLRNSKIAKISIFELQSVYYEHSRDRKLCSSYREFIISKLNTIQILCELFHWDHRVHNKKIPY